MPNQVAWKLVSPVIFLSLVLLAIGMFAAWSVHRQQQANSDALVHDVSSLLAIESTQIDMRETRYRTNMFLRTLDSYHIRDVLKSFPDSKKQMSKLTSKANSPEEIVLIEKINNGFLQFVNEFTEVVGKLDLDEERLSREGNEQILDKISYLADYHLTGSVLTPIEQLVQANEHAMQDHNVRLIASAKQTMNGLLLLGLCGGCAGILMGWGVGRALGRSMIQLSVSLQDAAVKLSDARGMITLTRHSDLNGLQVAVQSLADDISHVVGQLQQRERELLRSEQLSQVGQLAAGMAHELRNPLMPIKMLVQAAMERPTGGLSGKSLEVLIHEISRLEKSIQSFLDFAKPPTPEKSLVKVAEVVQGIVFLIQGRCHQQSVVLITEQMDSDLSIFVDRNQLNQLVLNLVLNALDALTDGGEIHVEVARVVSTARLDSALVNRDGKGPLPKDGTAQTEHLMQLRVYDNGPGISADILPRLFEPFATTKETGMGLGLATCQRIVKSHGGSIQARNRPEGGAEFIVTLPCS